MLFLSYTDAFARAAFLSFFLKNNIVKITVKRMSVSNRKLAGNPQWIIK
jgi:hypothetical protein